MTYNNRISVFGDLMIDEYWDADVTRISPEAPVPVARVSSCETRLGGAANVANNLRMLGSEVELCGFVGDDDDGCRLRDICENLEIIPRFVITSQVPTTKKLRIVSSGNQLLRCDFEVTFEGSLLDFIDFEKLIEMSQIILFSDYKKGALNSIKRMLEICKHLGKFSIVDPKSDNLSDYKKAFVLKPNYQEFLRLFKYRKDQTQEIYNTLEEYEIEHLIVTCGDKGVLHFERSGGYSETAAIPVEVYDVTGAGDTFNAALAYALSCKKNMSASICFANACAGSVVQKRGTSVPSAFDIENIKSIWF